MTKNTIKSMSTATVDYIAKKLGCTATKAELTKQLATKAEELDKAYTAFKLIAKAEAEQKKQAEAEAQKQKQEALAKAEAEQKQKKQKKQKQTKEKKQKQDSTEKKQKQEANKKAVVTAFTLKDAELKEDSKKNKFTVFYKLGENKTKAVMEIFVTTKDFHICTKAKHDGAEYHESWGFKYDSRQTDIKAVKTIYNTVLAVLKDELKQKQTAQKQKKQKEESK